jgi:hypothetical protein
MIRRYFILLVLVIFHGCETNPPDPYDSTVPTARIFVNSNITGGEIFVDNNSTGKFTPDTIVVQTGTRILSVFKDGYIRKDTTVFINETAVLNILITLQEVTVSKIVLVEDFANVSCDPCVISNRIIHSLESNTYKDKIAVLKFPTYWPGPNDPMYLASKIDCDARINFYRVIVAPTVIVDGQFKPVPSDSTKIKQFIDQQLNKQPKFKIEVNKTLNSTELKADIKITFIDTAGLNFQDLVLHTVVVESEIEYSTPPGSNGETKFYHVVRKMLPSSLGQPLNPAEDEYQSITNYETFWNQSKLTIVAFIQNKTTKEILQAGIN